MIEQNYIIEELIIVNVFKNIGTIIICVKDLTIDLYEELKRTIGYGVVKNQEYDSCSFKCLNKKYENGKSMVSLTLSSI